MISAIKEFFLRIHFWINVDRIGPDIPTSYWKLYFRSTMRRLCKSKFKYFDDTAKIRPGSYIIGCGKISVGKRVVIRPFSYIQTDSGILGEEIIIEDSVLLAPGLHIYTNNHSFEDSKTPPIDQGYQTPKKVVLKHGCWVGANVVILPGVTIGKGSVIGAGSIVTKSIPNRVVAVGAPAKVIRRLR